MRYGIILHIAYRANGTMSQMLNVLQLVAKRAGFDLPPEAGNKIVEDSGGNLRKAILVLEALKMQSYGIIFCIETPESNKFWYLGRT
jgi:DNA polymerase III delta prime subunit